jgi:uncharacterized protein (DUF2249 family)
MLMKTETLDIRDDLRKGCGPFGKIMAAAAMVEVGDTLRLLAPFEPLPLFSVMKQQGFTHAARQNDDGDWEVSFTRTAEANATAPTESPCGCSSAPAAQVVEIDTRGMQPPQPLVTILEAAATLPGDAEILARTNRRPMHLYPELESRGFSSETKEETDGSFITYIRRR